MRPSSLLAMVLLCVSVALSAWSHAADEAEPRGFAAATQLDGFEPTGQPAVVEGQGLVVPGMLHSAGDDRPRRVAALWHVASGEVEVLDPPLDAQGQAMVWRRLTCINAQGQLVGHVQPSAQDFNPLNWDAYLRQPDGECVKNEAVPRGIDEADDFGAHAIGLDDQGRVVGERFRRNVHGGGEAFIWSHESGMQLYNDPPDWERLGVNAVNPEGIAVGSAGDSPGGWSESRPVVCFAPDDTMVLDAPPGGGQFPSARAINARGQVLVGASDFDLIPNKDGGLELGTRRYLSVWDPDEGWASLPTPNHAAFRTIGFSDAAEVLFWGQANVVRHADRRIIDAGLGYLCRDGVLYRLPEYPGAAQRQTFYTALSPQGHIVGYALIPIEGTKDATRPLAFVLPPQTELQPVETE